MKNLSYFAAGLIMAIVIIRAWEPAVGRYQLVNRGNDIPVKVDTATGRIWALHTNGNPAWVEIR